MLNLTLELLKTKDTDPELILAHLNSLLTEINAAYFSSDKNPADDKLSKYISFKSLFKQVRLELPIFFLAGKTFYGNSYYHGTVSLRCNFGSGDYTELQTEERLFRKKFTDIRFHNSVWLRM